MPRPFKISAINQGNLLRNISNRKFLLIFVFISNCLFSQDSIQQKINYYISQAKLDSAKTFINSQLKGSITSEVKSQLSYELVKIYFMQSSYDEALKEALNSLDTVKDKEQRAKFNFMIGVIYSAVKDFDKSIEYFDLAVKDSENPSLTVKAHLLLSDLYLGKNDSLNSGQSLTEAYKITSNLNLDVQLTKHVDMQYSFFSGNYKRCKELNFEIVQDTTSFLQSKSYAYSMIGDCLIKQDSLIEATKYFDEFLKLTVETKDPEQIKVSAQKLINVYELLGDQEKANAYHKIYNEAVNDSLSFSVEKYRDLYNVERIRELKKAETKNMWRNIIFCGLLIFLLSIATFLLVKRKNVKKIPGKKISISTDEIAKMNVAINELTSKQLFLKPNITRKSFCEDSKIKSERYLSQFINEKYKKSFSVFINDLRVEFAYNRLQNESRFRNYKIEEIAKESGFGSKKSFERAFFAKYSETPFKIISKLNN